MSVERVLCSRVRKGDPIPAAGQKKSSHAPSIPPLKSVVLESKVLSHLKLTSLKTNKQN